MQRENSVIGSGAPTGKCEKTDDRKKSGGRREKSREKGGRQKDERGNCRKKMGVRGAPVSVFMRMKTSQPEGGERGCRLSGPGDR